MSRPIPIFALRLFKNLALLVAKFLSSSNINFLSFCPERRTWLLNFSFPLMKFADTFSERRFSEGGERLTFFFLCDDMQLSYYGPLWSPFNLLTVSLLRKCVTKYSRTVCVMYIVQNFALVAGGFYATGRSTAIYHILVGFGRACAPVLELIATPNGALPAPRPSQLRLSPK
jgi:hypothetical protein